MPEHSDPLRFDTVSFSERGAFEIEGNRALVFVPRSEVQRLELAYASGAERPLVTGVAGAAVTLLSLVPGVLLIMAALHGGGAFPARWLLAGGFVVPGAWMLHLSVRKRWVVLVHTSRGIRRLIFQGATDRSAMEEFLGRARARFGYQ